VSRANQNDFCPVRQFYDRAATLAKQGHTVDKIEIIVLGGTWSGYPWDYQYSFVRDLFFAANTFDELLARTAVDVGADGKWAPKVDPVELQVKESSLLRDRMSLLEEQTRNEVSECKIIGLTLETRPDYVTVAELRRLRELGCTRVQIGVQHTDDEVLRFINRGCTLEDAVRAVALLKQHCFKVDIHLMPDLPSSTPEKDWEMFDYVLHTPHLQADHWKVYPCEVTPFSAIETWFQQGSYVPYTETDPALLVELLVKVKAAVHPWIRLNRVIRDIPKESIIAGNTNVNLRQVIFSELARRGQRCRCIRCREVRDWQGTEELRLVKRYYRSSEGDEVFITMEGSERGVGGGAEQRGLQGTKLR
jgi:ELP3 family radical SAM enzyme/protein acetyltransferase